MKYRTVFMALLLVVACAFTAHARVEGDEQEEAATEITRLGGTYERDEAAVGRPIFKVDLHGTKVTDAELAFLKKLKNLRTLDLRLTQVGDDGVAHLKNLTSLRTLNLFRTNLSDRGLKSL